MAAPTSAAAALVVSPRMTNPAKEADKPISASCCCSPRVSAFGLPLTLARASIRQLSHAWLPCMRDVLEGGHALHACLKVGMLLPSLTCSRVPHGIHRHCVLPCKVQSPLTTLIALSSRANTCMFLAAVTRRVLLHMHECTLSGSTTATRPVNKDAARAQVL